MYEGKLIFSQVIHHLPMHTFRRCVQRYKGNHKSSSPREPPPQALTEPDVNVSAHPAPIVQPFHPITASVQTTLFGFPLCGLTIELLVAGDLSGVCISV